MQDGLQITGPIWGVFKAGLDVRNVVGGLPMPAQRTRASSASDQETLAKLDPARLVGSCHVVDVWKIWREACKMRVQNPKYKMPTKWHCVLCWQLTGKRIRTVHHCVKCKVTLPLVHRWKRGKHQNDPLLIRFQFC
jgi:hypothetical protein